MTEEIKRPKPKSSLAEREMDKAQEQFDAFDKGVKELTLDRMNEAPKQETEPRTKISQSELEKSKDIYMKPSRTLGSKEKFNEDFRSEYEFQKEYVRFIPEHKEIIGERIEMWTKPFPGMPAEYWEIPTGKPVWAPRYVAEQISRSKYHRLKMQQNVVTGSDGHGQYYGSMAVDTVVQRLDAIPVSERKSIFMGAKSF